MVATVLLSSFDRSLLVYEGTHHSHFIAEADNDSAVHQIENKLHSLFIHHFDTHCFTGNVRALVVERNRKMAESAHAYVRGSTKRFYEWLSQSEHAEIPTGPAIWICGDCHSGNLRPVANGDGALAIQIRDLNQTVIGNPVHDLIRLALSLAMAARSSDLPGVTTALMLERMIDGYSKAFITDAGTTTMPSTMKALMREAAKRSWKHLADERIEGEVRQLPIGPRFWPLTWFEKEAIEAMFAEQRVEELVSALPGDGTSGEVKVVDAAFWKKGCSSLGRIRVAALLAIGKGSGKAFRLMDIKEAVASSAPRVLNAIMPVDNAGRVVDGARHLSPYLGSKAGTVNPASCRAHA